MIARKAASRHAWTISARWKPAVKSPDLAWVKNTEPKIATPMEPPTAWTAVRTPEADPISSSSTAVLVIAAAEERGTCCHRRG